MSEFDAIARDWDNNQRFIDRSKAVARAIEQSIPLHKSMKALEYGSGTGLLSFELREKLHDITLMDSSSEMTAVTKEKIAAKQVHNMNPIFFDLENQDYNDTFDLIFNQMVMHHVNDVDALLIKFHSLLNPGGYLAIADLYSEDGSFHGEGFTGHLGFDVEKLVGKLNSIGYRKVEHQHCYSIERTDENGKVSSFPIFLITALK